MYWQKYNWARVNRCYVLTKKKNSVHNLQTNGCICVLIQKLFSKVKCFVFSFLVKLGLLHKSKYHFHLLIGLRSCYFWLGVSVSDLVSAFFVCCCCFSVFLWLLFLSCQGISIAHIGTLFHGCRFLLLYSRSSSCGVVLLLLCFL